MSEDMQTEIEDLPKSLPRTPITPETITQNIIDRWYRDARIYKEQMQALRERIAEAEDAKGRVLELAVELDNECPWSSSAPEIAGRIRETLDQSAKEGL